MNLSFHGSFPAKAFLMCKFKVCTHYNVLQQDATVMLMIWYNQRNLNISVLKRSPQQNPKVESKCEGKRIPKYDIVILRKLISVAHGFYIKKHLKLPNDGKL